MLVWKYSSIQKPCFSANSGLALMTKYKTNQELHSTWMDLIVRRLWKAKQEKAWWLNSCIHIKDSDIARRSWTVPEHLKSISEVVSGSPTLVQLRLLTKLWKTSAGLRSPYLFIATSSRCRRKGVPLFSILFFLSTGDGSHNPMHLCGWLELSPGSWVPSCQAPLWGSTFQRRGGADSRLGGNSQPYAKI